MSKKKEGNTEDLDLREFIGDQFEQLEEEDAQPEGEPDDIAATTDTEGEAATEDKPSDETADETTEDGQPEGAPDDMSDGEPELEQVEAVNEDWSKYGFKKENWEALNALDETTRQAIKDRQESYFTSRTELQGRAEFGDTMKQAIEPHKDYLKQLGMPAEQVVGALIAAERNLRTGNPQQKALALRQLAHDYGIDVNEVAAQPFDPNHYQLQRQIEQQQRQIQNYERAGQSAEEAQINQTIEQFALTHEHYDEVRTTMADLLESGVATDLDDAYAKAVRLDENLFQKVQASQQAQGAQSERERLNKAAKAAKSSAVSVKGGPAGGRTTVQPKTTEDAVAQAMINLGL